MPETISQPTQMPPGTPIKWLLPFFLRPRQIFMWFSTSDRKYWLTPMLILTITTLTSVLVSGWLKAQNKYVDEGSLPADFQYYSPEQQAQYLQAIQVTQGPVFVYILPALVAMLRLVL